MDGTKTLPKMSTSLAKSLSQRNFDADKFAKSISAQSDGDKDLQENRQRVHALGEDTAQILKKQVYHNYQQFIDTAKEISFLEGEMFQLNHILTEQKNLMDTMTTIFASKAKDDSMKEDSSKRKAEDKALEQKKAMSALRDKMEGCANIIDAPGRHLVHDGDVSELDTDSFNQISKIHLFLFNDSLMVTTWVGTRRGNAVAGKYKYQVLIPIDTLAIVNARDVGRKKSITKTVKNAFNVLVLPESRMFQCENSKEKREWLEIMDSTKRKHLADREKPPEPDTPTTPMSPNKIFNPFMEMDKEDMGSPEKRNEKRPKVIVGDPRLNEEWIVEMPEDLDVFIAQRNFEQAVEVILKTKDFLSDIRDCPAKVEVEEQLHNRTTQLVDVLSRELKSSPDRSLRGGPRVVRRPVVLLIRLHETSKACSLFLSNRSSAVTFAIRQLRTEGSLSLYISKLCKVFFNNLEETAREFNQAFIDIKGCYSSFVVWSRNELTSFVDTFSQQVFGRNADISEVAECVQNAQSHCERLHNLGLDLSFLLNNLLLPHIQSSLRDHKQKIIDATKLRNSEELWRPSNLGTPQATERLVGEMMQLGLKSFVDYCYDGCFSRLTGSTLAFTRAILTHVESAVKMMLPDLQKLIVEGTAEVVMSYTEFTLGCVQSETERPDKARLIKENAKFVADSLLPLVEMKIQKRIKQSPRQLNALRKEFASKVSSK
ncbi:exocyst complex component 8-like isoform X1 [Ciona intestinalis]